MNNWKQFLFFTILVIVFYQLLYFISDIFFIKYIHKYRINLNFVQGSLNFLSLYLPYILVNRIFKNSNKKKECKND